MKIPCRDTEAAEVPEEAGDGAGITSRQMQQSGSCGTATVYGGPCM